MNFRLTCLAGLIGTVLVSTAGATHAAGPIQDIAKQWSFDHFAANAGRSSEIVAFDSVNKNLWVVGGNGIDVLDLGGTLLKSFETASVYGGVNSIAISNGVAAVAFKNLGVVDGPGSVQFFDTTAFLTAATVGAANRGGVGVGNVPDMVTWTAGGTTLLVANEGERAVVSGTTYNAAGSVSIIDYNATTPSASVVTTAGFSSFDGTEAALRAAGVRIQSGVSASVAFEPEYIAVAPDGKTAHVTLQEANAIGILDLQTRSFTSVVPLGTKDFSLPANTIDPSDRPTQTPPVINFVNVPVKGMYQPDGIAAYSTGGKTFYVMANEGDAFTDDSDIARVGSLTLDEAAFGGAANVAALKNNNSLGRLNVSVIGSNGANGGGSSASPLTELVAMGGRSFSIRDENGVLVFDSGDRLDKEAAALGIYDDARSDDKGVEPEGVALFNVAGRTLAFIGLERTARSAIAVYDVTDPANATFLQMIVGDLSAERRPEGLLVFESDGKIYLAVANEGLDDPPTLLNGSNRTMLFQITPVPEPSTYALMAAGLFGLGWAARRKRS